MTATRIAEFVGQAKKLRDDAKAMLLADTCTAEDITKAEKMRQDADGLVARASQLQKLELADTLPHDDGSTPDRKGGEDAGEFKNSREFYGAVAKFIKSKGRKADPRLKYFDDSDETGVGRKELSGQTGAGGGILIPTQSMSELMAIAAPLEIVRAGATNIDMTGREVQFPVVDQTSTTAGQPHFFGGVSVGWTEEGSVGTSPDAAFRQGKLVARELTGKTIVTNSLLDDAPALATFLNSKRGFPGAIAWAEDYAFLRGDGVGKPMGIVNAPATIATTRTTASNIKYDDLALMEAAFLGESPMWIASISAKANLLLMNGPSGNPSYLWGSAKDGTPATLLGHPIKFTDKLPALGARGDIMLVDLSYYLIGTRQSGTTLEASDQQYFGDNKTIFRIVHRVDGQPWLSKEITLVDGTTKISPFVVIAA